jgi:hypothetical protein
MNPNPVYCGDLFCEPGSEGTEWFMVTETMHNAATRVQRMAPAYPYIPRVVSSEFVGLAAAIARLRLREARARLVATLRTYGATRLFAACCGVSPMHTASRLEKRNL